MKRSKRRILIASVAGLGALGLAACGNNNNNNNNSNDVTCATGTTLQGTECVPDGSVICGQGTVYDMGSGACVPDPSACADGTVLVDGQCVPNDSTLTADADEAAEPNDTSSAGTINVPDVGADGYVIHGCITPRDSGATADVDPWLVTVDKPTLLDVTADGVGGLAAGFAVQVADANLADLKSNGWIRFGINLTGDTSSRQLFLPKAGTYALVMADSRQLFLSAAVAGSADTCYYTTITQLAIPTPTAISSGQVTGTIGGDVQFYSTTPAEGDFLDGTVDMTAASANASVVAQVSDAYRTSGEASSSILGTSPAEAFFGGLSASDTVVFVVDPEFNYGIAPADFTLTVDQIHADALPSDGSDLTTTELDNLFILSYFDVAAAGDMVHFDLTFADDSALVFVDSDFNTVGTVSDPRNGDDPIPSFNGWVRFEKPGRYYALFFHQSLSPGDTSTVTSTFSSTAPAAIAVGTPVTGASLVDDDSAFYTLNPGTTPWLAYNASASGFGGDVQLSVYDDADYGVIGMDVLPTVTPYTFNPDGSDLWGAIVKGLTSHYVLQVEDTGTSTGATFDLSVDARDYTDLGMVTEAAAVSQTGESIASAGDQNLYLVTGTAGDQITVTINPAVGFRPTVEQLDRDEQGSVLTATASGEPVEFQVMLQSDDWVAFAVAGDGASTGTYDISVTAVTPKPYTVASGSLSYTDVCSGGSDVTPSNTDEGTTSPQAMPFAFTLFGAEDVTSYSISTNGFLSFNTLSSAYGINEPIPTAGAPEGILAPYWDDLDQVQICEASTADTLTIQWTGVLYDDETTKVEMQVVMHSDGSIDYIYGANQEADGTSGTVGAEDLSGTIGNQIVYNTASSVTASTSQTLTPQ